MRGMRFEETRPGRYVCQRLTPEEIIYLYVYQTQRYCRITLIVCQTEQLKGIRIACS